VLFEESKVGDVIEGFTDNYLRVELPYDRTLGHCILPVRLGRINPSGHLTGEIVEQIKMTT